MDVLVRGWLVWQAPGGEYTSALERGPFSNWLALAWFRCRRLYCVLYVFLEKQITEASWKEESVSGQARILFWTKEFCSCP